MIKVFFTPIINIPMIVILMIIINIIIIDTNFKIAQSMSTNIFFP